MTQKDISHNAPCNAPRIGEGYDVHRLVAAKKTGRKLILGGVEIAHDKGLDGHSDADVLLHAICDALLGALALGDIGQHFPPGDAAYKDADSQQLLRQVAGLVAQKNYVLGNLDCTLIAEKPGLASYIPAMRKNIAACLVEINASVDAVSVKATTTESLGFSGREEGIAARAVVLLFPV